MRFSRKRELASHEWKEPPLQYAVEVKGLRTFFERRRRGYPRDLFFGSISDEDSTQKGERGVQYLMIK